MQFRRAILMSLALAACGPAAAQIYRCGLPGGSVSYQELPCDATAAQVSVVAIPSSYPDHTEARDRLAAREAASDARRMKRLEIEAMERIARDERAAREAALEAERERNRIREAEGGYPLYFVGRPPPFKWRDTRGASGTPRSRPRT